MKPKQAATGPALPPRFNYDAVVKDLFQKDRPSLLDLLTGNRQVREFLNPEFAVVEKRIADLLILLDDRSILHLDFQSSNDDQMPYRAGIYALMAAQKYRCPVQQVVLYLGKEKLSMADSLDAGSVLVQYRLMDVREFPADAFLRSGRPGDFALAMLARGGISRLREIVERANRLQGARRQRVLAQLAVLSGLRRASEQLTMEFRDMGISVELKDNVFLRDAYNSGLTEGEAKGKAEGKAEGMATLLAGLLEDKFGPLPKWAEDRLRKASITEAEQWAHRVLSASSLEGVLGKRR